MDRRVGPNGLSWSHHITVALKKQEEWDDSTREGLGLQVVNLGLLSGPATKFERCFPLVDDLESIPGLGSML